MEQALPIYHMLCFKLFKNFLHELTMIIAKFWWRRDDNIKKIHCKSWENLCISKFNGDLGFKDFETLNLALLASQ